MNISQQEAALDEVRAERERQNKKWGEQNHDPITWSAILSEKCGEFAQAALQQRFGGPAAAGLRTEAIQCAAVAVQIVEYLDRIRAGKVPCAACDRGDFQLGHADGCKASEGPGANGPAWTAAPPTEPGYYWMRTHGGDNVTLNWMNGHVLCYGCGQLPSILTQDWILTQGPKFWPVKISPPPHA